MDLRNGPRPGCPSLIALPPRLQRPVPNTVLQPPGPRGLPTSTAEALAQLTSLQRRTSREVSGSDGGRRWQGAVC